MRGLKTQRTASVVIRGHAFIQNLRRGHYELETETNHRQLAASCYRTTQECRRQRPQAASSVIRRHLASSSDQKCRRGVCNP
jgi:hypothetical protein